jgi:hypothetical protein
MCQRFEETFYYPLSSLPYITATFSSRGLFFYPEQRSSELPETLVLIYKITLATVVMLSNPISQAI